MKDNHEINPGHGGVRSLLRLIGPLLLAVAGVFLIVGLVDFFSAIAGKGRPTLFWCFFVAIPLLGIGSMITKFAFFGAVIRYLAEETAPVGKDTFNYVAQGTKETGDQRVRAGSRLCRWRGIGLGVEPGRCRGTVGAGALSQMQSPE